ncbi:MAG: type II CRISPR-associated endonuclease Cas1 [Desulfovibrio sp.]|nr:type II CRISPR-associated endonuclease Cas1 [Desulfovibrio sp.]
MRCSRGFVLVYEGTTEIGRIPIDNLLAAIISAEGATLAKSFFVRLGEANIPIIICGKDYMPLSIAVPVTSHHRHSAIAEQQVQCPPVLRKQLWKSIIQAKIHNQTAILAQYRPEQKPVLAKLRLLQRKVKSGDTDNHEAQAARLYWPALMGKDFIRRHDLEGSNSLFNYAYAIVRSCVARAVCAAGLLPMFGVHHHNMLNAFCLVDDLMEPLRPVADAFVVQRLAATGYAATLDTPAKRHLSTILVHKLECKSGAMSFIPATNALAQSFADCMLVKESALSLPLLRWPDMAEN